MLKNIIFLGALFVGFSAHAINMTDFKVGSKVVASFGAQVMTLTSVDTETNTYFFSLQFKSADGHWYGLDSVPVKIDEPTVLELSASCEIRTRAFLTNGIYGIVLRQLGYRCPDWPPETNTSGVYL